MCIMEWRRVIFDVYSDASYLVISDEFYGSISIIHTIFTKYSYILQIKFSLGTEFLVYIFYCSYLSVIAIFQNLCAADV